MRSGAYTTPIEISRKTVVTTDYGTDKLTWITVWKTKADVKYISEIEQKKIGKYFSQNRSNSLFDNI